MSAREHGAEFWDSRYAGVAQRWSANPNALMVELAGGLAPGRALDVGAGEGRNALYLARSGWRVTALDVSGVALERAAERARVEQVELECVTGDWREFSPTARFDLAVLAFMHPDADERGAMFARVGELLVPGGRLFVVGVDLAEHGRRGPKTADRLLTVERVERALEGFEIVRCESVAYEGEGTEGRRPVRDVVAVARRPGADG
ncbi:MAG: class I SAM-dependent methyltransferase [Thermoleophilaceae bacterium]